MLAKRSTSQACCCAADQDSVRLLTVEICRQRSYWYTRGEYEYDEIQADAYPATCANTSDCVTPRSPLDMPLSRKTWIDAEYTDESVAPKIVNGVKMGEGDGTVSLLSLGAMCVEGWKRKRWNPAGMSVVTVEVRIKSRMDSWMCI